VKLKKTNRRKYKIYKSILLPKKASQRYYGNRKPTYGRVTKYRREIYEKKKDK